MLAAEIVACRQVGIRIEPTTLMFFDLDMRELLRTRPNPLDLPISAQRGSERAALALETLAQIRPEWAPNVLVDDQPDYLVSLVLKRARRGTADLRT